MHYEDLTLYEYYLPFKLPNVFNIGWLDKNFDFINGNTSMRLLEKLNEILLREDVFKARVNQIRGVHPCNFCGTYEFHNSFIGSCELWVPNHDKKIYFAAPSLLVHYIQEHNYCPPKSFIDIVIKLDLEREFNGQEVYDNLLKSCAHEE